MRPAILIPEDHPLCKEEVIALKKCLKKHEGRLYFAPCWDQDIILNRCLKKEKEQIASKSFEKKQVKAKELREFREFARKRAQQEAESKAQQSVEEETASR
eukprot:TRINITY_DN1692_c0_g1_i5.p6 TRINITY_DN1692_c0_g1~~TRINITY_DN1692_c0_g1_i5.p6  ORF type:complete len:101 (+),score=18.04 TRINITY_DN1692_c0_g1_i5:324-626(+)